jgi:3-deoxy-D-manno-octulosonic-acid transferase
MDRKERLFFYILLYILQFLRIALLFVCFLPLGLLSAKFRQRWTFERLNRKYPGSKSFYKSKHTALMAFHVSSEGELEQVRPMINFYLESGEKIELLFTSESVEKKVERIYLTHSDQVRILRLPLLAPYPFINSWVTAGRLLLVRYDFYPELLLLATNKRLFLAEATLKNKKTGTLLNWLRLKFYSLFEKILCASQRDLETFSHLGLGREKLLVAPLRLEQISDRLSASDKRLSEFKAFSRWEEFLKMKKREHVYIFGNYWEEEKALVHSLLTDVKNREKSPLIMIVPHLIHPTSHWEEHFENFQYQMVNSLDEEIVFEEKKLIIFNVKGVLVELYHYAGLAYVGGGFGRSVHSLAEPFVAGCFILCGPRTHRSTEYDFIRDTRAESIKVIDKLSWPQDLKFKVYPTYASPNLVKEAINFIK